jgi:hypothetical protein
MTETPCSRRSACSRNQEIHKRLVLTFPWHLSREWNIATRLRGGRSRVRNLVWRRYFSLLLIVYTDEGGPPSLLFDGYRVLSRRPVMLTIHHHLAPKLQWVELHLCSPYMPSCRDRENFTFFTSLMHSFGFRSVATRNVQTVATFRRTLQFASLQRVWGGRGREPIVLVMTVRGKRERTDSSCGNSEGEEGENR